MCGCKELRQPRVFGTVRRAVFYPAIGVLDFASYDLWEQGVTPCAGGPDDDSCWEWAFTEMETQYGPMMINTTVGTAQTPPVPWQLLWVLDWGWFVLLGMTVIFLPDSPPLKVSYELDTASVEETERIEEERASGHQHCVALQPRPRRSGPRH